MPGAGHDWPLQPAPHAGKSGEEILRELGLDYAAIVELKASGAIRI
jgi:crotonobetainyl-CoA:carnitine CoA-transferase CaiB-like acyl-CoA transferase